VEKTSRRKSVPSLHETNSRLTHRHDGYYQAGRNHVVTFLQKFGYRWSEGVLQPLSQTV